MMPSSRSHLCEVQLQDGEDALHLGRLCVAPVRRAAKADVVELRARMDAAPSGPSNSQEKCFTLISLL